MSPAQGATGTASQGFASHFPLSRDWQHSGSWPGQPQGGGSPQPFPARITNVHLAVPRGWDLSASPLLPPPPYTPGGPSTDCQPVPWQGLPSQAPLPPCPWRWKHRFRGRGTEKETCRNMKFGPLLPALVMGHLAPHAAPRQVTAWQSPAEFSTIPWISTWLLCRAPCSNTGWREVDTPQPSARGMGTKAAWELLPCYTRHPPQHYASESQCLHPAELTLKLSVKS